MIVYITTNLINNKKYIGSDSKNNPKYLGSGVLLKKAIKKYGKENFKKEILEVCSSLEELRQSEIKWINYFNAFNSSNYYNRSEKGHGIEKGHIFGPKSQKTKEKISFKIKENKVRGDKISKSNKGRLSPNKNKKLSDTHKQNIGLSVKNNPHRGIKISNKLKGRKCPTLKPILQYDLENNFIKEWESITQASNTLNINQPSISKCASGRQKTAYGFIWKYKNI